MVLAQTMTLRPHVFDAWRERDNYRSVSMTFFVNCDLNITVECNGELKCCALYACELRPLCVCGVCANVLVTVTLL